MTEGDYSGKPAGPKPQSLPGFCHHLCSFHISGKRPAAGEQGAGGRSGQKMQPRSRMPLRYGDEVGKGKCKRSPGRWVAGIAIWSFVLAVIIGFVARFLLNAIYSLLLSFLILGAVIALGIVFDIIGTAAAAADQAPLNARASRRIPGARRAVDLVRNADRVANFCNDVVGDISGIVSGTLAAVIISRLAAAGPYARMEIYGSIVLTALVAALTVGGKALGKNRAITRSTEIIMFVGTILLRLENMRDWLLLRKKRR